MIEVAFGEVSFPIRHFSTSPSLAQPVRLRRTPNHSYPSKTPSISRFKMRIPLIEANRLYPTVRFKAPFLSLLTQRVSTGKSGENRDRTDPKPQSCDQSDMLAELQPCASADDRAASIRGRRQGPLALPQGLPELEAYVGNSSVSLRYFSVLH